MEYSAALEENEEAVFVSVQTDVQDELLNEIREVQTAHLVLVGRREGWWGHSCPCLCRKTLWRDTQKLLAVAGGRGSGMEERGMSEAFHCAP